MEMEGVKSIKEIEQKKRKEGFIFLNHNYSISCLLYKLSIIEYMRNMFVCSLFTFKHRKIDTRISYRSEIC